MYKTMFTQIFGMRSIWSNNTKLIQDRNTNKTVKKSYNIYSTLSITYTPGHMPKTNDPSNNIYLWVGIVMMTLVETWMKESLH